MNYFGPHEHSKIDFSKLAEAPIFLISGDTGAGKSTIFDAMTYALFGTTTSERDAREMRSQFASCEEETSVTFYFEQGNFIYKVVRKPEQELKKMRGTGTKKQNSTANLTIVESIKGKELENLATKPADVGNEMVQLLHLNAEQFKKIILLPQNDFSQFLKSKTDEKEAILKKIFGTGIFTEFSNQIKMKFNLLNEQNQEFQNQLAIQFQSAIWSNSELEKIENSLEEEKFDCLHTLIEVRKKDNQVLKDKVETLRILQTQAQMELQKAVEIESNLARKHTLETDYATKIMAHASEHEENQVHYQELLWASSFKQPLSDISKAEQDLIGLKLNRVQYQEEMTELNGQLSGLEKQMDRLNEENELIETKKQQVAKISILIPQAKEVEKLKLELEQLNQELRELNAQLEEVEQIRQTYSQEIIFKQQARFDIDEINKESKNLNEIALMLSQNVIPQFKEFNRLDLEKKALEEDDHKAKETINKLQRSLSMKKADYELKIQKRRQLMIAQLQNELVEGEPCLVCGSIEHHAKPALEISNQELKEAMEDVDESQRAFAATEVSTQQALANHDQLKVKLENKLIELERIKNERDENYVALKSSSNLELPEKIDLSAIEKVIKLAREKNNVKFEKNKKLTEEINVLEIQALNSEQKGQSLSKQVAEIMGKIETQHQFISQKGVLESSLRLEKQREKLSKEIESFEWFVRDTTTKKIELERLLEGANGKIESLNSQINLTELSLEEIKSKVSKRLNASDAQSDKIEVIQKWLDENPTTLSNKIEAYQNEKLRLEKEIKQLEKQLTGSKLPDINHLTQVNKENEKNYIHAEKELATSDKEVDQAIKAFEKIEKLRRAQGKLAQASADMTQLWNAVNGKTTDKLKLETFVVQSYLEQVLDYANHHFINVLSNNRYQFELSEVVKGNGSQGLNINIYDNETGATRSSSTMSGGETFIAALSIALSLSEVVQNTANGVQIDALFVDEGFGSLDQETLQKAMTALEQIGENRMVGVISHVEEMKKSIGQQLLIKKIGDGRSKIERYSI